MAPVTRKAARKRSERSFFMLTPLCAGHANSAVVRVKVSESEEQIEPVGHTVEERIPLPDEADSNASLRITCTRGYFHSFWEFHLKSDQSEGILSHAKSLETRLPVRRRSSRPEGQCCTVCRKSINVLILRTGAKNRR